MCQPRSGTGRFLRAFVMLASSIAVGAAHPASAQLTNVDSATDVCPPTLDPCIVSQSVQIVDGAVLDFGTRGVDLRNAGKLDVGTGTVTVMCGSFVANVGTAVAIEARGPSGDVIDGGSFTLQALRSCSADPSFRCITEADCFVGPCNTGTCAGAPSLTCEESIDCDLGLCAVGSGDVDINGEIRTDGRDAGEIVIHAAGDLIVRQLIDATSGGADFDGGTVELFSGHSSVTASAISARSGAAGQGGTVSLIGGESVTARGLIDVSGGDFDGGFIGIESGADVLVESDLVADSIRGEGSGGEVSLLAGGDILVTALRTISANGSPSRQTAFAGDGGVIEAIAQGDIVVPAGATLTADGEEPDGSGDSVTVQAGRDLTLDGILSSRARGNDGQGGTVEAIGATSLSAAATAIVDVRGGAANGGDVLLQSGGPLAFAGTISAQATQGGTGDSVRLESAADLLLSGDVTQGGQTSGEGFDGTIDVVGCAVTLAGGASLTNTGARGVNSLAAHDGIAVQAGAQMIAAEPLGANRFVVASDSDAPIVQGTVDPAAVVEIDDALAACSECGNARVDVGETCDDGNEQAGDGCSLDCQNEGCIAQTLNWPNAPLCNDDLECTRNECDTETSTCANPVDCDDGFECTVDACDIDGSCLHDEEDAICDDANTCTADECLASSGCISFAEEEPCDDGLDCTSGDTCVDGTCDGAKNCPEAHFCSNVTGDCVAGSTTTTISTTTTTVPPPVCGDGEVEGDEECDDGDTTWALGQPCNADCFALACGDADDTGDTKASDSLIALRSAVGGAQCHVCLCDVDSSGMITATDALALLRAAVGLSSALDCPACFPPG